MPVFLVESYQPQSIGAHAEAARLARRAAEIAGEQGIDLRYLRTTLLPTDETCFHLFEAPSVAAVEAGLAQAGLGCDRIVEALTQ
jgi:hypothetical protein